MSEEDYKVKANNTRIAVTAVMTVLFGIVFILALILFGMNVQEKVNERKEQRKKETEVVTINSVDFETTSFSYSAPMTDESGEKNTNYLIKSIYPDSNADYLVINSKTMLEDVLNAVRRNSNIDNISYDIDSSFFESGSVIAVTREAASLSEFKVNTVTRDADYNLQINGVEKYDQTTTGKLSGYIVFIKISNIQPKGIEIKVTKE